jgi:phage tail-like protein
VGDAPSDTSKPNATPVPAFCFKVTLDIPGFTQAEAFFKSVGGLKMETEAVDVRVAGYNHTSFKLVGATKTSNLVLKRGFSKDSALLLWRMKWLSPTGDLPPARASGSIIQLGNDMKPVGSFSFTRAFPVKWELSEYDAGKNELAIETLELAHDGLTYK